MLPAADPPPELMELTQPEAVHLLHDHHGGIGDVQSHLDDRGGDEDLDPPGAEPLHHGLFFRSLQPAVHQLHAEPAKGPRGQFLRDPGRRPLPFPFADKPRADDVGLAAGGQFPADRVVGVFPVRGGDPAGRDRLAPGRKPLQDRDVEVAPEDPLQRARDRRCGHQQAVGGASRLVPRQETLTLQHAKAVLFVDHHEREPRKKDAVGKQCVRTNHEIQVPLLHRAQDGRARGPHPRYQDADPPAPPRKDLPEVRRCWAARISVGRERRPGGRPHRHQGRVERHGRLADPTSPTRSLCIGEVPARSAMIAGSPPSGRARKRNGSRARIRSSTRAPQDNAGAAARARLARAAASAAWNRKHSR